jgi:predicted DNA-binding antitoxin AbrB/MazE fold protein
VARASCPPRSAHHGAEKELASPPGTWQKKDVKTIHAVYERGVFRPLETVELPERTEVEFEPRPVAQPEDHKGRLDAVYAILGERYQSGEHDVAARHNENRAASLPRRGSRE